MIQRSITTSAPEAEIKRKAKLCSVVVPMCNEEPILEIFYRILVDAVRPVDCDWEFIFVDDGSTDASTEVLTKLRASDHRIKVVRFTRNFGSHPAIFAGLTYAKGETVTFLSADLQDPPALIPQLYARWQQGFDAVLAVRQGRDDPWTKKVFANTFLLLFRAFGMKDFPLAGFDFALMDRKVVDVLTRFREHDFVISPMIVWTGFRRTEVPYKRQARRAGRSKWPLGRRLTNAIDLFVSYSYFPIRIISCSGIVVSMVSFLMALFVLIGRLAFGFGSLGWPSIMIAVFFLGGVQLIMLGILGEYLWRTANDVRNRPLYIVMEEIGLGKCEQQSTPEANGKSESV